MSYIITCVRNISRSFGERLTGFFSASRGGVYDFIGGGDTNTISAGYLHSSILGGREIPSTTNGG